MPAEGLMVTVRGGALHFIYNDALLPLLRLGDAAVQRASHVEPYPAGGWTADMAPSDGPKLGPFGTRREALDAERNWLRKERGL